MDFGKVAPSLLDNIDFSWGQDHPNNGVLLQQSTGTSAQVHVGCAKWGRPDWLGKIYPKGTKADHFLDEYAKQFKCIELNALYYQLPKLSQVEKWKSKVGSDFLFCPKFTNVITHEKRLQNVQHELDLFLEAIYSLKPHLGPLFLMPHPQMGPEQLPIIQNFLELLPKDIHVFVEVRHPDWFRGAALNELLALLEQLQMGTVITDAAGRRDAVHMRLSQASTFIRFVGNSLHASDYTRIDAWVQKIKEWLQQGLQSCYFFMHQHDELYSPELCKYLIEQLNQHCSLSIPAPRFQNYQSELF